MICYKDKTFCKFYIECKNGEKCERALTLKVIKNAEVWWDNISDPAPVMVFNSHPKCFINKGV